MRDRPVPPPTLAGPPAREWERGKLDLPTQRARLNRLMRELELDPRSLGKDGSGDWTIAGTHGDIHALPRGYELFVHCDDAERWTWARSMLDFAFIFQQKELSGIFWLSKMPAPDEGDEIVAVLGLRCPADVMVESLGRILAWRAPA